MKKLLTILVLIMLIISFFQIAKMYALYTDQLQGDYTNLLGVWAIKVNGVDISSGGDNLTFNMTEDNLTYVDSSRVKSQKIAPGTQAYFDIAINPTNTDVSILYTLNLKFDELETTKMKLVRVENHFRKNGETEQITNSDVSTNIDLNKHQALIPIEKINDGCIDYVRLYFEWINDETFNDNDSELGSTDNAKISIPIEINFKQYTGEVIGSEM